MYIHVVKRGETLFGISEIYGVSPDETAVYNGLSDPDFLVPGQTIVILDRGDAEKEGTLASYGYAYPFVSGAVLEKALPYLSGMASFAYGFTASGGLVEANDAATVGAAIEYGVTPMMTLSTLGADGRFSSELASMMLNSETLRDALLDSVAAEMRIKGFRVLDVDFEYIDAADADRFVDFISRARELLSPEEIPVFCALAPKTSDGQRGALYEGHDYAALGQAADRVLLMTYEWGYTYGPPMAVAPIGPVRRVAEYALSRIPSDKIMLGVPNYGYDWKLPYVRGESRAVSIGCEEAVDIARANGAEITYDETAAAPYFSYIRGGEEHTVWFEDARSIRAKLELASELKLSGFGIWNLTRPFTQLWLVYESLFQRGVI